MFVKKSEYVEPSICYTVRYVADDGGTISGKTEQSVIEGRFGSSVTAVADAGYYFVKWDDNYSNARRYDRIYSDITFTAIFAPLTGIHVRYNAEGPGYISGEVAQCLDYGETTQAVVAVAYPGSRFVGWSDGVQSEERTDVILPDNNKTITFSAKFEELPDKDTTFIVEKAGNGYLHVRLSDDYAQPELVVPAEYYGMAITLFMCQDNSQVVSITVAREIKSVYAVNCVNLTNVELEYGIEKVDISNCPNVKSLVIPSTVTDFYCKSLEHATIEDGIKTIHRRMFYGCKLLQDVNLPSSVVDIGEYAFYNCEALTNITIPNGVSRIGQCAFMKSGITSVTIPSSMKNIAQIAFGMCESLTSVEFLGNVETLGNAIFTNCKNLMSVKFPDGFTTIGKMMFKANHALEEVTIPSSVTTIMESAFSGCFALKRVYGMENVKIIGDYAFTSCPLEYIVLPNTLEEIGIRLFNSSNAVVYSRFTIEQLDALNAKWSQKDNGDEVPRQTVIYIGDSDVPENTQP